MMKIINSVLLFSLFTSSAYAVGIYQWTNEEGKTIYGNEPPEYSKSKQLELPELTIVKSRERKEERDTGSQASAESPEAPPPQHDKNNEDATDRTFTIEYPAHDEQVRANNGNITVKFALDPPLAKNETITVYMDGKQVAHGATAELTLEHLDRGTHSLFAVIEDANGNIVMNSDNIQFHLHRHSALF